jgi:hypothetical protein
MMPTRLLPDPNSILDEKTASWKPISIFRFPVVPFVPPFA